MRAALNVLRRAVAGGAPAAALIAAAAVTTACGAETAGRMIFVDAVLEGGRADGAAPGDSFANARGWHVTLTEALVGAGPLYVYEAPRAEGGLTRWFGVPSAHAHVTSDRGRALTALLNPVVMDLVGAPIRTAGLSGVTGRAGTFDLNLGPPAATVPGADRLGGAAVRFSGAAEREGRVVRFSIALPLTGVPGVEAAPTTVILAAGARGELVLTGLVDRMFTAVDFTDLGDGPVPADSSVAAALTAGVRNPASWKLEWRAP